MSMNNKFKVGDRVRFTWRYEDFLFNQEGIIMEIKSRYGVRFDIYNSRMHNLEGKCDNHHGWYCEEEHLSSVIVDNWRKEMKR